MNALGWTLLHSLWQGAGIALCLAICLGLLRDSRARYAASCLALCAMLAAACVTYSRVRPEQRPAMVTRIAAPAPGAATFPTLSAKATIDAAVPYLGTFWISGALLFYLRSLLAWKSAHRLRRQGAISASPEWQSKLQALAARLQISRYVALCETCLVDSPAVTGHWNPLILAPAGFLTALAPEQIELILMHELAHIRRHDYLVNMLQRAVEDLFFYHPAAWWIAARIRVEREHCCDDAVVNFSREPKAYASALIMLEEMRAAAPPLAVAASGGNLVKRIQRLLDPADRPRSAAIAPWLSVTVAVALAAVAAPAWQQMTPYEKWVNEDVVYIISPEERNAFLALQSDEERLQFIGQFWARRDPTPATPENEMKEEHYRRIAYASERYGSSAVAGWKSDRGQMYIKHGPPDEIESHPSGVSHNPFERWLYHFVEGKGKNYVATFIDIARNGEYRQQDDGAGRAQLQIAEPKARLSRADGTLKIDIPLAGDIARQEVVLLVGNRTTSYPVTLCRYERVDGCLETGIYSVSMAVPAENNLIRVIVRNPTTAAERVYDVPVPRPSR